MSSFLILTFITIIDILIEKLINAKDREDLINAIIKNKIWLDKRTRVVASCNGEEFAPALNEIFVNRKNLTKTAEFEIKFQSDTVRQKMDGVIISTPS